jgi:hypothetical protein
MADKEELENRSEKKYCVHDSEPSGSIKCWDIKRR